MSEPAEPSPPRLPRGFLLGTSTASYQIEGAVREDGRGPSIWDTFAHTEGRVAGGDTGDVACDHYHRYAEDVALMRDLGATAYRFSIAWPRVQPAGSGPVNAAGLDFYDRLLDELAAAGIAPMVTLYHWDLPQALEDAGGWLARDTADRFAEYAAAVADRLGDRVESWAPVNEPNVAALFGYATGWHAPGRALSFDALPAAHHLLLAHGRAVQALRAAGAATVGTAINHMPVWPASQADPDREAARLLDLLWNRLYADPVLLGSHPAELVDRLPVRDGDLAAIAAPLDFYGVNYYAPQQVRAAAEGAELPYESVPLTGYPTTEFGWPVVPEALTEVLVGLARDYPDLPPVRITENGCSYAPLEDRFRIDYLDGHLRAVADAVAQGVDVRGYYCWSLLDNFEWAEGYRQRFGLVHVDYATQRRTPRASFDWYAGLIRAQRSPAPGEA